MEKIFDQSLYNDDFFEWHFVHARNYSIQTMNWFLDNYPSKSVIDFGCGIGSYLESAYIKGLRKLKGFDIGGEHAKKFTPAFLQEFIEYVDCTIPIKTTKYDVVISFETAEHIEPSGSDVFIQNLANACELDTGLILFTGAPPEQDGCGHINGQYKDFWLAKFEENQCYQDVIATEYVKKSWKDLEVGCPQYIYDNLIILKKTNKHV